VKTIGLIGFSYDTSIAEYYQQILNTINPINNDPRYDIRVYSIRRQPEEIHLIARLYEVYFYMMSNGAKALIFTDYKLERLSHYVNLPGKPLILSPAEIIANKIKLANIKKCLVFDLSLSEGLDFFLKGLVQEKVNFYLLNIQDRDNIKNDLELESDISNLSAGYVERLNKVMSWSIECGVQAILIDSPILNIVIQQLRVSIPIFYIRSMHALHAIDFLTGKL
jgi:aspartate/glutamate racemase